MKRIRSACTYDCPDACSLIVELDSRGAQLRGDPDHSITRGFLCQRIRRHTRRLSAAERVTSPRLRQGSRWHDVEWEEALDLVAARLGDALSRHGPPSVVCLTGGGSLGLSKELIPHYFNGIGPITTVAGGPCGEAGEAAQRLDFGDTSSHDYTDIDQSSAVVLWGKNPVATGVHLVPFLRAASKRGAPVVLIEVRTTESTGLADRVIKVAPSGDGFLAMAVLRRLLDSDAFDEKALGRVENIDDVVAFLRSSDRTVERSAARAGVSREDVDFLTNLYSKRRPVGTWIGWGLQRRVSGGKNVRWIDSLGLLSGNIGVAGGGVHFTSVRRRGLNFSLLTQPSGRRIDAAYLGPQLAALRDPRPRFLYVACANPVTQMSHSNSVRNALKLVDFVVVADAFFTDTAEAADLFLPVTLMLEEEDVVGSYQHHHIALGCQVLEPPELARNDLWILNQIDRRLGRHPDPLLQDPSAAVTALTQPWFAEASDPSRPWRNPYQPTISFVDGFFPTPSGKARLCTSCPETVPQIDGYPLLLLTPSCRRWQTSQRFEEDQQGKEVDCVVHPEVTVAENDGPERQLVEGERIRVESPIGAIYGRIRFDDRLGLRDCVIRRGGWLRHAQGVNTLIECQSTDLGGGVSFYDQRVRILPCEHKSHGIKKNGIS